MSKTKPRPSRRAGLALCNFQLHQAGYLEKVTADEVETIFPPLVRFTKAPLLHCSVTEAVVDELPNAEVLQ